MSKHQLFQAAAKDGLALSFDDVRLKSGYTNISAAQTNLETKFSRRLSLKQPIVSSPMDTVTEAKMAIAMARAGGLGVIHRSLSPADQAAEVNRVKLHLNAVIEKPVWVEANRTIREVEQYRQSRGFNFQSFPVLDQAGRLVGLITQNDFEFSDSPDNPISQVMTPVEKLLTAPLNTDLETAYTLMIKHKKKVLPLVNRQGEIKGMYIFSDVKRVKGGNSDGFNLDRIGHLRVAAAVGIGSGEIDRALRLAEKSVDALVIDTAHGDSKKVIDTLKTLKKKIGRQVDLVAGNVSEGDSARRLLRAGADGIRVGQGPGSICTTRVIAGIGCPQVSAIYNSAQAAAGTNIPICADGGINNSGDITIALAAGAQSVMLGRLLAGTDEAPGEKVTLEGRPYKIYRGMGSLGAMADNQSSRERYGQQPTGKDQLVPEGVEGAVPYTGSVGQILHQYLEGLRRGMGYVGAATIAKLNQRADFHRITAGGLRESHPHHIQITKDAPNYNRAKQ